MKKEDCNSICWLKYFNYVIVIGLFNLVFTPTYIKICASATALSSQGNLFFICSSSMAIPLPHCIQTTIVPRRNFVVFPRSLNSRFGYIKKTHFQVLACSSVADKGLSSDKRVCASQLLLAYSIIVLLGFLLDVSWWPSMFIEQY